MTRTKTRANANMPNTIVSVLDFGADPSGSTDSTAAIRSALDYLGARNGGTLTFGPGVFVVSDTILIPRTLTRSDDNPATDLDTRVRGITLDGAGCEIQCSDAFRMPADRSTEGGGAVFETAQESFSTNATSNYGQNEAYPHYNLVIKNFNFKYAGICLKMFNAIMGCSFDNLYAQQCNQFLILDRCFYANVSNCILNGRTCPQIEEYKTNQSKAAIVVQGSANVLNFVNNHVGGDNAMSADGIRGIGLTFSSCASMIVSNCASEGFDVGISIGSITYDLTFDGIWLEGCTTGFMVTNKANNLNVRNTYFNVVKYALSTNGLYESGEFGQDCEWHCGIITCNDPDNPNTQKKDAFTAYAPKYILGQSEAANAHPIPQSKYRDNGTADPVMTPWSLEGGISIVHDYNHYIDSLGVRGSIGITNGLKTSVRGGPARHYICNNTGGDDNSIKVPFTVWSREADHVKIATRIKYANQRQVGLTFDLQWSNGTGSTELLSGSVSGAMVVRSDESDATIAVENEDGFYVFKITDPDTIDYQTTGWTGLIRVI